ncbi:MAG: acyl-CoA dehydrogenase family protein [Syntrophobacteraceae bacterium]
MDFNLTEEHELIRQSVREFSDRHVCPISDEVDQEPRFPAETVKKLGEQDLMGIPYPMEYGGAGADYLSYIIVLEELSRACTTTGLTVQIHTSQAEFPLFKFGTEEQKKKYLIPLCTGEMLGSLALTEPEGGIDPAAEAVTALPDGDEWVLNGSRMFVSNASSAGVIIVFARTDESRGTEGISAFIVSGGTPGLMIGRHLKKVGIRGVLMSEVSLENCRIPKENLLGIEGQGCEIARMTLDGSRIGIAAEAVGIAQAALEESISYSRQRVQFGKPIAEFEAIQAMIANMAINLQAARLLTYQAAWCYDQGLPYSSQAAMAKLFASEMASSQTNRAVQVHGGMGYVKGAKVERLYRDGIMWMSYDGTTDMMRKVIADELLS